MGLSETIVAAIIGALATMGTAIFQLVRNRAPSETRPKKNRTRSVLATIALMIPLCLLFELGIWLARPPKATADGDSDR